MVKPVARRGFGEGSLLSPRIMKGNKWTISFGTKWKIIEFSTKLVFTTFLKEGDIL